MRQHNLHGRFIVRVVAVAASVSLMASSVLAQGSDARVGPIKGAVIKGGQNAQLVFCVSSDATSTDYRINVWQVIPGQTAETAVAANKIIVTTTYHAINTKGAGGDRLAAPTNPDVAKSCAVALKPLDPIAPAAVLKTRTKSNNTNERTAAATATETTIVGVTIDNFPVCAGGRSCQYAWTIEPVTQDGQRVAFTRSPQAPFSFAVAPDGTLVPANGGRK